MPTSISASDRSAVMGQLQTARSNTTARGKMTKISSPFDLINSSVSVPTGSGRTATTVTYPSPLNDQGQVRQLLPLLLDKTTTTQNTDLAPRVNVNTAPQVVLTALEQVSGLGDGDVSTILATRPPLSSSGSAPDPIFQTPAWLITEANLDPNVVKKLGNYITARSFVYRVQSVGYFDGGGPVARVEAVVDTNLGRPRIVYWRSMTDLGHVFKLH
jgi:hypothetical protein